MRILFLIKVISYWVPDQKGLFKVQASEINFLRKKRQKSEGRIRNEVVSQELEIPSLSYWLHRREDKR